MPELTILSRSGRHKAVVGESAVTYYKATISHTGMLTWRFARQAEFTLPHHAMLDVVSHVVNEPKIYRGR